MQMPWCLHRATMTRANPLPFLAGRGRGLGSPSHSSSATAEGYPPPRGYGRGWIQITATEGLDNDTIMLYQYSITIYRDMKRQNAPKGETQHA